LGEPERAQEKVVFDASDCHIPKNLWYKCGNPPTVRVHASDRQYPKNYESNAEVPRVPVEPVYQSTVYCVQSDSEEG